MAWYVERLDELSGKRGLSRLPGSCQDLNKPPGLSYPLPKGIINWALKHFYFQWVNNLLRIVSKFTQDAE